MAARFYTNPFTPNAPMVALRRTGEWKYMGLSYTMEGTFKSFVRDLEYSDGSVRTESRRDGPITLVERG